MSENPFEEPETIFRSIKQLEFLKFEKLGEEAVRAQIARGRLAGKRLDYARDWLSRFDEDRASAKERRRDDISEETLLEARRANDIATLAIAKAKMANTIAGIASIIAAIAIAVSIAMPFILGHFGIKP